MGNVAQQGLAQLFLHFAGIAEAVVELVAQKPSTHPSHNAQHQAVEQTLPQAWLLGIAIHLGRGDQLPGQGVLSLFQLEGGPGA